MRHIDADKLLESVTKNDFNDWLDYDIFQHLVEEAPTADVVPKSEVDKWYQLYHSIKEELKQEKMYHRETEKLCDRYCIESQQAKKQVAREIFEDFTKHKVCTNEEDFRVLAELKKKYTEGENEKS